MFRCITLVGLLMALPGIHAKANPDSLWRIWENVNNPDTVRLNAIHSLVIEVVNKNLDSAAVLAFRELDLARASKQKRWEAHALNLLGAISDFKGRYGQAVDYYQKSLLIRQELGDEKGMADSYNNIGLVYCTTLGDHSTALDYFKKVLSIHERLKNNRGIAEVYSNIGVVYDGKAEYLKALDYYEKSLPIWIVLGDKKSIADTYNNIGFAHYQLRNYDVAMDFFEKSLPIYKELQDLPGIANSYIEIGSVHHKYKSYRVAIRWCKDGLSASKQFGSAKYQMEASQCLYESYKALGDNAQALHFLEIKEALDKAQDKEDLAHKLTKMEFVAQMQIDSLKNIEEQLYAEKSYLENIQQVRTKEYRAKVKMYVFLFSGVIVLMVAGGLWSRLNYIRKTKELLRKEKNRAEKLLRNILPEFVAEELKEHGAAHAMDVEKVTVLFTDFKEFTKVAEQLSANELVRELDYCFKAFDGILEKYNIEKIKTFGDSYMAAGGLPVPTPDSAGNTVKAALEMQAFIRIRRAERIRDGKPAFEMRAGIHTGPVVAGIVGLKKFQYDIWGDTVNTANRMESSGEEGKVNISEVTYNHLKGDPTLAFEARGKVLAKNKGKIKMYFVEWIGEASIRGMASERSSEAKDIQSSRAK